MSATDVASRRHEPGTSPLAAAAHSGAGDRRAGQAAVPAGFPSVALAAAVLAADGVLLLLVGSAALSLRGEPVPVGDVDVVIEPGEQNLRRLHVALADLALRPCAVPPPRRLVELPIVMVATSFGRIDCLLERGRYRRSRHADRGRGRLLRRGGGEAG